MLRLALVIFIFSISVYNIKAQPNSKIEHYSTEDGLSHDIITCMFKDKQGFMWFGTWDGINRFDGHKFRSFRSSPGDMSQLKNDRIDQITEDEANHLWIKGYDGQIYRFDKSSEQFMPLSAILGLTEKTKITFDKIITCDGSRLWLSTAAGELICVADTRSNSSSFIVYKKTAAAGFQLPLNHINFFYEDKHKTIWLGTPDGLVRLSKSADGVFRTRKLDIAGYEHFDFTAIAESGDKIYLGTAQGQLVVYNRLNNHFSLVTAVAGRINALCFSKQYNLLYLSTVSGSITAVNTSTLSLATFTYNAKVPLYSMYEDKGGNLWIEPDQQGVIRFDPHSRTFKSFQQPNDSKHNYAGNHFKVFEDNRGLVWTIMKGGGFGYYNQAADSIAYFYDKPGSAEHLFSNIVSVVYYDRSEDVLWLYSDLRGIEKIIFQPNEFSQHLLVDRWMFKSDNEVRGLLCDRKNRIWTGAKSGSLYVYANGLPLRNLFVNPPPDGIGSVYAVIQDNKGSVWLGTKANGLYRADPVDVNETHYKLTHFQSDPKDHHTLSSDEIYALLQDKQGRIWVGTFDGGLNLFVEKQSGPFFLRLKDMPNVYPAREFDKIRCMALDKDGTVWIGTTNGLALLTSDSEGRFKVRTFSKKPGDVTSLGNNDIQYIYRDTKDRMWLATCGGGLNLAQGNALTGSVSFKVYTTKNGLPNDYLLSCTEDKNHYLWVATQSGLSRFEPATERFQNYNSYDGVPKVAFSEASSQRMRDGKLIFGTIRGYLSFDPQTIRDYPITGNMAFTNLQVNNTDVKPGVPSSTLNNDINNTAEIRLNYHQNIFSIDYVVLDYRGNDKQTYFYRLRGFDTLWHDNQNQLRATYTNLPPGNYVFEVKCIDPDLYKNVPLKQLAITILPPPWRTWWAYMLYVIVAAIIFELIRRTAVTMLGLRQRIAIEQKLTELKVRFFTNISHELRTPLTLILNPIEEIAKQEQLSAQGKQYLTVVRRNANRMARFINQLLDLRKVQSGKAKLHYSQVDIVLFVKEIGEYFNELAREKHITLNVNSQAGFIYACIDADKIETVMYNLISNAYKFTPEGKEININIKSDPQNETITLEVADQGSGVAAAELKEIFELYYESDHKKSGYIKGTGIGLALSKELVALHSGTISAKNNTSGGLSVSVSLPLIKTPTGETAMDTPPIHHLFPEFAEHRELYEQTFAVPANAPTLLLVEDNTDMREFLTEKLRAIYRVEVAENGEEGLKKALKHAPDIVVSDVMMPKMDGIQLLDKLKNTPSTSHVPVILLSAKSAIESQIEGIQYGADHYITKPFNNEFFLAAIASVLALRKKLAESLMNGKRSIELAPGDIIITSKDEQFLKRVIQIVEEKMADADFNIDTVAAMVNMGRTSFFGKFKSLTQMAPVEFVREMRLKRAKQYFDAGTANSANITEVAYTVGFNNAKYFSTCFKAKYNVSPSDYLKARGIAAANDKVT